MMSQSDPYVLINVLGSSLKPIKTKVLKGNANPVWNETFGFDVSVIDYQIITKVKIMFIIISSLDEGCVWEDICSASV